MGVWGCGLDDVAACVGTVPVMWIGQVGDVPDGRAVADWALLVGVGLLVVPVTAMVAYILWSVSSRNRKLAAAGLPPDARATGSQVLALVLMLVVAVPVLVVVVLRAQSSAVGDCRAAGGVPVRGTDGRTFEHCLTARFTADPYTAPDAALAEAMAADVYVATRMAPEARLALLRCVADGGEPVVDPQSKSIRPVRDDPDTFDRCER